MFPSVLFPFTINLEYDILGCGSFTRIQTLPFIVIHSICDFFGIQNIIVKWRQIGVVYIRYDIVIFRRMRCFLYFEIIYFRCTVFLFIFPNRHDEVIWMDLLSFFYFLDIYYTLPADRCIDDGNNNGWRSSTNIHRVQYTDIMYW